MAPAINESPSFFAPLFLIEQMSLGGAWGIRFLRLLSGRTSAQLLVMPATKR